MPRRKVRRSAGADEGGEKRRPGEGDEPPGDELRPAAEENRNAPGREHEKDDEGPAASAAEPADGVLELMSRLGPRRQPSLLLGAQLEAVGQAKVGDRERDHGEDGGGSGPGRAQGPPAPDHERDRSLDRDDDPTVWMHGGQEPGRG
jgi:hypothetical protein